MIEIKNLTKSTDIVSLLPGILGVPGVSGIPVGSDMPMGIDLIEMLPDTAFPMHTHPGAHILYVLSGQGTVTIDSETYPTRPGDCYFVPADIPHSVGAHSEHRVLAIGFPHKKLRDRERMAEI